MGFKYITLFIIFTLGCTRTHNDINHYVPNIRHIEYRDKSKSKYELSKEDELERQIKQIIGKDQSLHLEDL